MKTYYDSRVIPSLDEVLIYQAKPESVPATTLSQAQVNLLELYGLKYRVHRAHTKGYMYCEIDTGGKLMLLPLDAPLEHWLRETEALRKRQQAR